MYHSSFTARQLVNFKKIPMLLETSEASYHAVYDDCTFAFLEHAGVPVKRLELGGFGDSWKWTPAFHGEK